MFEFRGEGAGCFSYGCQQFHHMNNKNEIKQVTLGKQENKGTTFDWDIATYYAPPPPNPSVPPTI